MKRATEQKIDFVPRISRILLGVFLIVAAGAKGMDVVRFGRNIEIVFGIYGEAETTAWLSLCFYLAWLIIALELILGSMLITGYRVKLAARAALLLLMTFALVIIHEMIAAPESNCDCFGALIERSSGAALVEDCLFICLAVLSGRSKVEVKQNTILIITIVTLVGLSWTLVNYLKPLTVSAVREGNVWRFSETGADQLVWMFEPDCIHCQDQVELLNHFNARNDLPQVVGFTSATEGRMMEFRYDFEPEFRIIRISERDYKRIFLPAGSLLLVNGGKVIDIWRPLMIPQDIDKNLSGGDALQHVTNGEDR